MGLLCHISQHTAVLVSFSAAVLLHNAGVSLLDVVMAGYKARNQPEKQQNLTRPRVERSRNMVILMLALHQLLTY